MAVYEIYRNTAGQVVTFNAPAPGAVYTATIKSQAFDEPEVVAVVPGESTLDITVPFKFTQYDGTIDIDLKMTLEDEVYDIKHTVEVVTPLLLFSDLSEADRKSINLGAEDEEDFKQLERFIRHIIEAYTGQSFGYSWKTYLSENPRNVTFNAPLLEFIGVSERYATHSITVPGGIPYEVLDDGFAISLDWNLYHAKSDTFFPSRAYRPPAVFYVEGKFGYVTVPEDVRQAALVLLGLFRCDQSLWRDRYIENLRNADGSSVKYNEGAYVGTGSVAADQLLLKYVRADISSADVV